MTCYMGWDWSYCCLAMNTRQVGRIDPLRRCETGCPPALRGLLADNVVTEFNHGSLGSDDKKGKVKEARKSICQPVFASELTNRLIQAFGAD